MARKRDRKAVELDGYSVLKCDHKHVVELIVDDNGHYEPGTTLWKHGDNAEAVKVVAVDDRQAWASEGRSSVAVMEEWIEQVHEYQAARQ